MFSSFSRALSALNAHATAVDVVGNNLANLNTPGYKASVVYFRDLVARSMGLVQGQTQVGTGVGVPVTVRQFTQGAVQPSSGPLDAAIQGDGFFIVRDPANRTLYTRAGSLHTSDAGRLLTATGERVQGWTVNPATGTVDTNAVVGDLQIPVGSLKPPRATTALSLDLNLNAQAAAGAESAFSAPIEVFDSLGASHIVTMKFEKTGANQWKYEVFVPGDDLTGGTPGALAPVSGATGTLTFSGAGVLTEPAAGAPIEISVTGLASGAADLALRWDLYGGGAPRLTQFGQPSAVTANVQDGSAAAQLVRVALQDGGRVVAQYSNGQDVWVGQLALAAIRNPDSLLAAGNNNYTLSPFSAAPAVGLPGTGGRGAVAGASVEFSTVDIAREFTNLIVLQRGYQANSRVVTTADELSQETINLKR